MTATDPVPRIFGKGSSYLTELLKLVPVEAQIAASLKHLLKILKEHSASFVPFGIYHILVQGQLHSMDSQCQPDILAFSLGQLLQHMWNCWVGGCKLLTHPMEEHKHLFAQCYQQVQVPADSNGIPLGHCHVGLTSESQNGGRLSCSQHMRCRGLFVCQLLHTQMLHALARPCRLKQAPRVGFIKMSHACCSSIAARLS